MNRLSNAVLDYKLEIRPGATRREVTYAIYDPHLPPAAPPRLETWERGKKPIGTGGQGRVFVQKCVTGGQDQSERAVKMIPCIDGKGKQRYLEELESMAEFSRKKYSRLFVPMLGWFSLGNTLCIVMEYLPQGDLHTYLREHSPLAEEDCQQVISQVLAGLSLMHKARVAHRDIKPQNILIKSCPSPTETSSWWVKLADFGISRKLDSKSTQTTGPVGTWSYMAPELLYCQGKATKEDFLSGDVWSVGATTFYLMTKLPCRLNQQPMGKQVDLEEQMPSGCNISLAGLEFLKSTLAQDRKKRLILDEAIKHAWVGHLTPALSRTEITQNVLLPRSSFSSSSSEDTSEEYGEMTSLATVPTNTFLDNATLRAAEAKKPMALQEEHTSPKIVANSTGLVEVGLIRPVPGTSSAVLRDLATADADSNDGTPSISSGSSQVNVSRQWPRKWPDKVLNSTGDDCAVVSDQETGNAAFDSDPLSAMPSSAITDQFLYAASDGSLIHLLSCIEAGVDIEARTSNGQTALHLTASKGLFRLVKALLDAKCDVDPKDSNDSTPLHLAAGGGHTKVLMLLINRGAGAATLDVHGNTPIQLAARQGHWKIVLRLVRIGAMITTAEVLNGSESSTNSMARIGLADVVQVLADFGSDITKGSPVNENDETALEIAVKQGHSIGLAVVGILLDRAGGIPRKPLYLDLSNFPRKALVFRLQHDINSIVEANKGILRPPRPPFSKGSLKALRRLFTTLGDGDQTFSSYKSRSQKLYLGIPGSGSESKLFLVDVDDKSNSSTAFTLRGGNNSKEPALGAGIHKRYELNSLFQVSYPWDENKIDDESPTVQILRGGVGADRTPWYRFKMDEHTISDLYRKRFNTAKLSEDFEWREISWASVKAWQPINHGAKAWGLYELAEQRPLTGSDGQVHVQESVNSEAGPYALLFVQGLDAINSRRSIRPSGGLELVFRRQLRNERNKFTVMVTALLIWTCQVAPDTHY